MLNFDQHQLDNAVTSSVAISKYRRQLMLMFAALAMTCYAAQWSANPKHWEWLVSMDQQQEVQRLDQHVGSGISNQNYSLVEIPRDDLDKKDAEELVKNAQKISTSQQLYVDVDDNSTGLLRRELPAYFQMLKTTSRLTNADWADDQLTNGSFTQLLQSPSAFRGQKFRLSGDVLLVDKIKEPANAMEIKETYEFWLQTRDSGKDLYRIRSLILPAGMTTGEQQTHVEIYGLFFKRQNYASKHGNRTSPMLVTSRIELPTSTTEPIKHFKLEFFLAGACCLLVLTGLMIWHHFQDQWFEANVIHKLKDLSAEEKQALKEFSLPADELIEIEIKTEQS